MKNSKIVASLMLSVTLVTVATPVLADQIKQNSETTVKNNRTSSTEEALRESASVKTASSNTSSNGLDSSFSSKSESVQMLKEQKMIIKKIIAKGGSQTATISENNADDEKTPGIAQSDYKGVPNSKFVIYDVTDLMENVIKEKLGVSEEKVQQALATANSEETQDSEKNSSSSTQKTTSGSENEPSKNSEPTEQTTSQKPTEESSKQSSEDTSKVVKEVEVDRKLVQKVKELRQGDTLRKTISERAAKLNKDQLKSVTEVTTDEQGKAEATMPIDAKYHAYYVVNTETSGYATNSSPIVVITPVTDSDGNYAVDFTIYPKSDVIEEEQPTQETPQSETTATMYQTGHKEEASLFTKIKNWIVNFF